eukprot:465020-Prymnesium_polylepis.1
MKLVSIIMRNDTCNARDWTRARDEALTTYQPAFAASLTPPTAVLRARVVFDRRAVKVSNYRVDVKPVPAAGGQKGQGKGKGGKGGKGKGGGRGGRGAGRAGAAGALSIVVAAGAPRGNDVAPAPPLSAGHEWQHAVSAQVTTLTGSPFKGFQAAGAAHTGRSISK